MSEIIGNFDPTSKQESNIKGSETGVNKSRDTRRNFFLIMAKGVATVEAGVSAAGLALEGMAEAQETHKQIDYVSIVEQKIDPGLVEKAKKFRGVLQELADQEPRVDLDDLLSKIGTFSAAIRTLAENGKEVRDAYITNNEQNNRFLEAHKVMHEIHSIFYSLDDIKTKFNKLANMTEGLFYKEQFLKKGFNHNEVIQPNFNVSKIGIRGYDDKPNLNMEQVLKSYYEGIDALSNQYDAKRSEVEAAVKEFKFRVMDTR